MAQVACKHAMQTCHANMPCKLENKEINCTDHAPKMFDYHVKGIILIEALKA